ncbi:serine protease [Bacillus sp. OxB-1]|uniref:TcaA NTF2-like domain-containing protein n=1 Tax=Bacillus sp. (strain OxB-1) TaxID=98228 RepID=UPI0005821B4D|nr:hypothetical protein [Bacillus sp. OxB-1]BAQ10008.1 serine protease [Bacillus sp. OxB-1]
MDEEIEEYEVQEEWDEAGGVPGYMTNDLQDEFMDFFYSYRAMYVLALNSLEFSYVEPYLSSTGSAYDEMQDYMEEIWGNGLIFNMQTSDILDITWEGEILYLDTYEAFDITDDAGDTETHYRDKTYRIVVNGNGKPEAVESIKITNYYE